MRFFVAKENEMFEACDVCTNPKVECLIEADEIKALTIEKLRDMDGEPVWCEEERRYGLVSAVSSGCWAGIPFFEYTMDGVSVSLDVGCRGLTLYSLKDIHSKNLVCSKIRECTSPKGELAYSADQMKKEKIWLKASCFQPEFEMVLPVPNDCDREEYIDEILDSMLSDEARYNVEWGFLQK